MTEEYKKKSITINNKNIVYFVRGNSHEAVVYCHGDGQNHTAGKFYLDLFPDNYKKIAIDLPGHGHSSDFDKRILETEVKTLDAIMKEEKIDSPLIIGHSHGGALALMYASRHSVKGLVLFDPLFDDPKKIFGRLKIKFLTAIYLSMARGKFDPNAKYHTYGNEKTEKELSHVKTKHTSYETIKKNLNVYEGYDIGMHLDKFKFPVLILQSEKPFIPSFKEHVFAAANKIPNVKVEIIKDATHNMPLLLKEPLAEKILENFHFLKV